MGSDIPSIPTNDQEMEHSPLDRTQVPLRSEIEPSTGKQTGLISPEAKQSLWKGAEILISDETCHAMPLFLILCEHDMPGISRYRATNVGFDPGTGAATKFLRLGVERPWS